MRREGLFKPHWLWGRSQTSDLELRNRRERGMFQKVSPASFWWMQAWPPPPSCFPSGLLGTPTPVESKLACLSHKWWESIFQGDSLGMYVEFTNGLCLRVWLTHSSLPTPSFSCPLPFLHNCFSFCTLTCVYFYSGITKLNILRHVWESEAPLLKTAWWRVWDPWEIVEFKRPKLTSIIKQLMTKFLKWWRLQNWHFLTLHCLRDAQVCLIQAHEIPAKRAFKSKMTSSLSCANREIGM